MLNDNLFRDCLAKIYMMAKPNMYMGLAQSEV